MSGIHKLHIRKEKGNSNRLFGSESSAKKATDSCPIFLDKLCQFLQKMFGNLNTVFNIHKLKEKHLAIFKWESQQKNRAKKGGNENDVSFLVPGTLFWAPFWAFVGIRHWFCHQQKKNIFPKSKRAPNKDHPPTGTISNRRRPTQN
jgi:hypothetical protein